MFRNLNVLFSCLLAATIPLQAAFTQNYDKTLPLPAGGRLEVRTDRATVQVRATDKPQVEVRARIEAEEGDPDGEAKVKQVRVELREISGGLLLTTDWGRDWNSEIWNRGQRPKLTLEIATPRNLRFEMTAARSRVDLPSLQGALRLNLDRTELTMDAFQGELNAQTDRGRLTIRNLSLTAASSVDSDRTEMEFGMAAGRGVTLDLSLDRTSHEVDGAFLDRASTREGRRSFQYQGPLNGGGPKLQVTADRGTLRLRRA